MYYKLIIDNIIVAVGYCDGRTGGIEITKEEYNAILDIINHAPTPADGYGLRLRADLAWEIYKLPEEIKEENLNVD